MVKTKHQVQKKEFVFLECINNFLSSFRSSIEEVFVGSTKIDQLHAKVTSFKIKRLNERQFSIEVQKNSNFILKPMNFKTAGFYKFMKQFHGLQLL